MSLPGLERFRLVRPALEWVVGAAILGELIVILLNIGVRLFTGDSVLWTQEVSEIALLTIAFVGGAIAYPKGAHMSVQSLIMKLPAHWKPYLVALADWLVFIMGAGAFALFIPTLEHQWDEITPILTIRSSGFRCPSRSACCSSPGSRSSSSGASTADRS